MLNGTTTGTLSAEDFAGQVFAGTSTEAPGSPIAGVPETEQYLPASPFAEVFELTGVAATEAEGEALAPAAIDSPFRSEYTEALAEAGEGPEREAFETLVAELYDRQFSEALEELAAEAVAAQTEQFGVGGLPAAESEQFVERYLAPAGTEAEALFERLADQYAEHDIAGASEDELDRLFESMRPGFGHLSPAFEDFLGGLWNKVKSVAKGAVNLAKKGIAAVGKVLPIGKIFKVIGRIVRPLLDKVLQFAIGRLPSPLQPAAKLLAQKLLGQREDEAEAAELETVPVGGILAASEADAMQREFDARTAGQLFAPEAEEEAAEAELAGTSAHAARLAELDAARDRFVAEIGQAQNERDVTAAMENFLPAVMAALKIGVTIVGRQRIVGFLGGLLAKLVGKLVGPSVAGPLSQAIVSTGMSLIGLELPADRQALAGEAVANAVEGTVRRLAEQGAAVLSDQRLLEAATQEAFAEAAAESFPPTMIRESLHEVSSPTKPAGTWVLRPPRGPRRYKRYTQVLDVTVTPQVAQSVRGFGYVPLATFLRSRYGVTAPVRCKAYLYEVLPGTRLAMVAGAERDVPGLGPGTRKGWRMFLPLTRATAAALFGQPGLGRDVGAPFLRTARRVAVGQRVVVLVPENRRPASPGREVTRASQLNLTLDFPKLTASAFVHLTEADAQQVAGSMRKGESVTPALTLIRNVYTATLNSMLSGNARRHVTIKSEVAAGEEFVGAALSTIGETVLKKVADKLVDWIGQAISEFFARRAREFVAAADDPAQGVTIEVSLRHDPLMQLLRGMFGGKGLSGAAAALAVARAMLAPAEVTVRTHAGFRDR